MKIIETKVLNIKKLRRTCRLRLGLLLQYNRLKKILGIQVRPKLHLVPELMMGSQVKEKSGRALRKSNMLQKRTVVSMFRATTQNNTIGVKKELKLSLRELVRVIHDTHQNQTTVLLNSTKKRAVKR